MSKVYAEFNEALRQDSEMQNAYQANIAMAIYDTRREAGESMHEWRNRCAKTFLNRLLGHPDVPDDLPGAVGLARSQSHAEGRPMSKSKQIQNADLLFGFCAWLTTRKEVISMGSTNDCAPVPPLIVEFLEAQGIDTKVSDDSPVTFPAST